MARAVVLVTEPIDKVGLELLATEADAVVAPEPSLSAFMEIAPRVSAFIVRAGPCPRELILAAPRLKVIGKHGVGVDNIDIGAATERGIPVFSTPGTNAEAVVEMALAMMLALAKDLRRAHQAVESNNYNAGRVAYLSTEMQGKTLGLIGLGRIGHLLAQKCAAAFAMRVLAYDPYVAVLPEIPGVRIELVPALESVLTQADFVSLHVPLTPETRGIVGREQLRRMKRSSFLVNTSRGAVVDEDALAEALREGIIAGAGIDVFAQEPTPAEHPLFGLDNVILSPHVGGQSAEAMQAMARAVVQGVLVALRGERPPHVLNPSIYEGK